MANPLYIENNVEVVQQGRALRTRYAMYGGTSTSSKTNVPVPMPVYTTIEVALTASSTTQPVWTAPNDGATYKLVAVSERHSTASSSGTLQVEVAGAAVAPASGTNQLTGTISLAGTANTNVSGTIIAAPTTITAASSVNFVIAGTMTNLAGCIVTVSIARVS